MLDRLRALLNRPRTAEDDVEPDTHVARNRETGGAPGDTGDRASLPHLDAAAVASDSTR